jgi:hypothetical protein
MRNRTRYFRDLARSSRHRPLRWSVYTATLGGLACLLGLPVKALDNSVGATGIDAYRLHQAPYQLTGRKIAIGQVEVGRPAQRGLDKVANTNQAVFVRRLFVGQKQAEPNSLVDEHAGRVASIMISRDKRQTGVAPNASLYSAAIDSTTGGGGQDQECIAAQMVASQNGGDVRAINFSFGESLRRDPRPKPVLDGNALLTQCVDWSTRVHNVLYSISGNQGRGGFPIPTDSFNGMTIANSMPIQGSVYNKVDFFSLGSEPTMVIGRDAADERNVGARRSVALVAPGRGLATFKPDGSVAPPDTGGTSFAAPHVTATVALLQEWGDRMIRAGLRSGDQTHWPLTARQSEVMKAVLMNSADKLQDTGNGLLLGMSRTLLDIPSRSWLDSDAYRDPKIPLDAQMGTGHLNAYRAYEQFSPGQWNAGSALPAIGWDYGTVGLSTSGQPTSEPAYRDYTFEQPLRRSSYISATLSWNRLVELQDKNKNGEFDPGESFVNKGLNNLDIYLMRAEDTDISKSVWSSVSAVDSVEHIFHQIPTAGRYKIRVLFRDRVNAATQPYALAWWAVPAR